ncbi:MAG: BREX-1 system adenine-specific DNA-methyltransferase PglX [Actinomycetota bacterium]|nr:BREX-1 system adenine-specific DNA-methyltransferase PglX [Actinomycetota bacterium]
METAPLKSFATSARTELIREVTARIVAVVAQGSPERVEQAGTVASLEREVAAAGGGDVGRKHVADKVAYVWFNRIIALRFMDANGYTGIGVVSPAIDQIGQPEVLAAAKRDQVDKIVVTKAADVTAIRGLLNDTRRPRQGVDAQAEAYALLLADYCRYWNRAMPFMFEREGDFTELLIPGNLLADDSVRSRAVAVLTPEVCRDVEVIGWLYQFYVAERKDEVFAGFKQGKKAGAAEIPAATQLFTPHWIVRYLVENSLGRLWMLNHPESALVDQMDYYIAPVDEETDFLRITRPEELKIIDPACGSGHMLTYAFDLLYAIYQEAGYAPADIPSLILGNNLFGVEIDQRAGSLAAFALAMKARAKQRTFFNTGTQPNICVLQNVHFTTDELDELVTRGGDRFVEEDFWQAFEHADTFGSLIQPNEVLIPELRAHVQASIHSDHLLNQRLVDNANTVLTQSEYLSQRYHIVVANPPYMSSKNLNALLAGWLQVNFAEYKSDLFAAYVSRGVTFLLTQGHCGLMTPFVWMFIAMYEPLRKLVLSELSLTSLVQLEYSGFEGATVPICAFTMCKDETDRQATFIRLADFKGATSQAPKALEAIRNPDCGWAFRSRPRRLLKLPGCPIAYWATERDYQVFESFLTLSDAMATREGMTTGNNGLFLRRWFEVSTAGIGFGLTDENQAIQSGKRWFPYLKGGTFRRWYGNLEYVVDWEQDGRRPKNYLDSKTGRVRSHNYNGVFGLRPGLTWSSVSSGRFAARMVPGGLMFDATAPMGFVDDVTTLKKVLALLNSSVVDRYLEMLAPTLHFKLGHVLSLPYRDLPDALVELSSRCIQLSKDAWDEYETSWDFRRPSWMADGSAYETGKVERSFKSEHSARVQRRMRLDSAQGAINRLVEDVFALLGEMPAEQDLPWDGDSDATFEQQVSELAEDLVSFAVGCMFGRYSPDSPGLILADQGAKLQDYLARIPAPCFMPDADNVIPIVDGDWFEDDIVGRFREFLRVSFGEEHFEENLLFVTESLGVRDLRDYFVKSFYKDHVQRYKKRPIYWLFSSPKGSFNALIYMHRYTPSTVSTVLTYLREYVTKLESSLQQAERAGSAKEADRLRKIIVELNAYEHDVLYPKASENIAVDLDDGVKTNYPKFGDALKRIPGLESSDE